MNMYSPIAFRIMLILNTLATLQSVANYQRMTLYSQSRDEGLHREAVVRRCFVKKVLLEISQNSQKNTCSRVSFLIKLQAWASVHTVTEQLELNYSVANNINKQSWMKGSEGFKQSSKNSQSACNQSILGIGDHNILHENKESFYKKVHWRF